MLGKNLDSLLSVPKCPVQNGRNACCHTDSRDPTQTATPEFPARGSGEQSQKPPGLCGKHGMRADHWPQAWLLAGVPREPGKMGVPGSHPRGFDFQGLGCVLSVQSCNASPGDYQGQPR